MKRILDFNARTDRLAAAAPRPAMNFMTDVQPIFTARCISCHGYPDKPRAGALTLVPDKSVVFNAAYADLWYNRGRRGVPFGNLAGAIGGGESPIAQARSWGSYVSPLVRKLFEDPRHAARVTPAERRRIAEWVDLNAPYYGGYCSNYTENPAGRSPLSWKEMAAFGLKDLRLHWGRHTYAPLYFDNPEKSPFLMGLPEEKRPAAVAAIRKGLERLRANPDIDWKGLGRVPGNPALTVSPWRHCRMEAWRAEKTAWRAAEEEKNRLARDESRRRLDRDAKTFPKPFPGYPVDR